MKTKDDQTKLRVTEAQNLLPFLAAEYNELSLAMALGKTIDPERYADVDQQLRRVELTIDTEGRHQQT